MIPIFRPSLGEEEFNAVKEVMQSGWIGLGPKTRQFERDFAAYLGVPHVIGMNSATAALHLALTALGIGPGDEVISPSLTFVSTNHAILYNGATPVFGDVEEETLTLDPTDVERKITPRTKAIMPMHYAGHPCEMDAIMQLAHAHNLYVVEDTAHATGALYKGRPAGTFGHMNCFSFHAVKNLTMGEGGAVATADEEIARHLLRLRWVGITRDTWSRSETGKSYSWYYDVVELGYKYHLSDIAAAIGIVQLQRLPELNGKRRSIVERYNAAFKELGWLRLPVERPEMRSAYHAYVVRVANRDAFMAHLQQRDVATSVHYIPNHLYDMYRGYRSDVPVTEREWTKLVTLPLFPDMTDDQVSQVIEAVCSFDSN